MQKIEANETFSFYFGKEGFPMYQTHSRRGRIRLASYLAALFVVLVATASIGAVQTRHYKTAYEESQQRALLELGEYMDHIESDLSLSLIHI